jgi:exodeoxyribonuclease VII large subunit
MLVRSYRTVSPLPVRARRPAIGGFLSVALSCGSPRLAVSQHPALWSPDLPRHDPAERSVPRPPGRLTVTRNSATTWPGKATRQHIGRVSCVSGGPRQLFDPEAPPEATASKPRSVSGGDEQEDRRGVLSIGGIYDQVEGALSQAFPRNRHLWVRGEIQHVSDHRSGHLYLSLVDPEDEGGRRDRSRGGVPTLNVKCWRSSWAPLRHGLAKQGIELTEGMVVVLRGSLDLYRAKGEISLILAEVDVTALLGRLAAQRAQLLHALGSEGLLRRNAVLPLPAVPLHVGLVASPGTEGCSDFLGQLTGSGFGFRVSHVPVKVQGPGAPAAIARALAALSRSDCDVIAVVRGGGARADLAAFEHEAVARAVALAAKPVFTGIGHTGDETVADIVAARACITPTECGQQIVEATRLWWAEQVVGPAALLAHRVPAYLADAQSRDALARGRLTAAARQQLRLHRERLARKASTLGRTAPERLASSAARLRADAARLGPLCLGHLGHQDERVRSWRRLLAAYDVDRQLERGYSLTLTTDGRLVRGAGGLAEQQEIVTRFADGSVRSRVEAVEPGDPGDGNDRQSRQAGGDV